MRAGRTAVRDASAARCTSLQSVVSPPSGAIPRSPARPECLRDFGGSALAAGAVPRAAAPGARLLDRRPAGVAGVALPPVDAELVLHGAARSVRAAIVGKACALARVSASERPA